MIQVERSSDGHHALTAKRYKNCTPSASRSNPHAVLCCAIRACKHTFGSTSSSACKLLITALSDSVPHSIWCTTHLTSCTAITEAPQTPQTMASPSPDLNQRPFDKSCIRSALSIRLNSCRREQLPQSSDMAQTKSFFLNSDHSPSGFLLLFIQGILPMMPRKMSRPTR